MADMLAQLIDQFIAFLYPGAQDNIGMDRIALELVRQPNRRRFCHMPDD